MGVKLCLCLLFVNILGISVAAPRSKSSAKTTYDQKQTGDYNVRLNLKDFQIVAIVDDPLGDLNYDYNYDYSELTVKPGSVSTTSSTEQSSTTTKVSTTVKPTIAIVSQQPTAQTSQTFLAAFLGQKPSINVEVPLLTDQHTHKPTTSDNSHTTHIVTTTTEAAKSSPETPSPTTSTTTITVEVTEKSSSTTEATTQDSPDRIPVFVQPSSFLKDGTNANKEVAVTNVAIVPTEDVNPNSNPDSSPLGEIMYYRKCSQGYTRDKRGRCRKVRRPAFPLGIARLASNLAAHLRPSSIDEAPNSPQE